MRTVVLLLATAALFAGVSACGGGGVTLPEPEEGNQYRMTELCEHLRAEGLNVRGTLHYTLTANDLSDLIDLVPGALRAPVEAYVADGVSLSFEVRDLCAMLGPS